MEQIKKCIEEIIEKLKSDDDLMTKFKENPISLVEELIGIDLPDDQIEAVVDGIKAKLQIDDIGDVLDKLGDLGKLGGLFGKKK